MSSGSHTRKPCSVGPSYAYPWIADDGAGGYRNPILYADYSDLDVTRNGNDFWLTASSFNCTPGLPILHSSDLVNWTLVNHALPQVPGVRYREMQPGCGVWAPSLRFHAGKFWIFFAMPDEGIYVTTAHDPRGVWSEPQLVQAGLGLIDPCPLWDEDGQAYLVHAFAQSRAGVKHQLRVVPMAWEGTRLLGEGKIIFHAPERQHTIEGPKFLKRDGWYYILAPAGGVATGWQTVLRSRNIFGPYEDKIVLHQGRTPVNGPHQGALVDTSGGEWWFLHFQDTGVYGRVVHLQPVEWRDGWPLMGAVNGADAPGEPVLAHAKPKLPPARITTPATSDEFSSSNLGLQWQWQANYQPEWFSLAARDGWLRLRGQVAPGEFAHTPHLLLQKFPAREFAVETLLDFAPQAVGDEAGLVVAGEKSAAVVVIQTDAGLCVGFRTATGVAIISAGVGRTVRLRASVAAGGRCEFSYQARPDSAWRAAGEFQAEAGRWIGAKVGVYCSSTGAGSAADANFDYFRFGPRV
jgi:beta-xylosidase